MFGLPQSFVSASIDVRLLALDMTLNTIVQVKLLRALYANIYWIVGSTHSAKPILLHSTRFRKSWRTRRFVR